MERRYLEGTIFYVDVDIHNQKQRVSTNYADKYGHLIAELPISYTDNEILAWLSGYKAGTANGEDKVIKSLKDLLKI